jgi:hypothetical protein
MSSVVSAASSKASSAAGGYSSKGYASRNGAGAEDIKYTRAYGAKKKTELDEEKKKIQDDVMQKFKESDEKHKKLVQENLLRQKFTFLI